MIVWQTSACVASPHWTDTNHLFKLYLKAAFVPDWDQTRCKLYSTYDLSLHPCSRALMSEHVNSSCWNFEWCVGHFFFGVLTSKWNSHVWFFWGGGSDCRLLSSWAVWHSHYRHPVLTVSPCRLSLLINQPFVNRFAHKSFMGTARGGLRDVS